MKTLAAFLLVVSAGLGSVQAQTPVDTTGRTITIPVPENGIIYIRSGKPGGVRIRSRHVERPAKAASPVEPEPEGIDLDRLARAFDRQGLDLYGELVQAGGRTYVVLRDSVTGAAADTLRSDEATRLVESLGAEGEDAAAEPLVERVERSLLDVGLFRSLQVHFAFDRSDLMPSALPTLDAVTDVLIRYDSLRIEVAGHTDFIGTDVYNQGLSERRASSVLNYLIARGVTRDRLFAVGYGEARPLISNATPTGRALNRRVEFRVVGMDAVDIEQPR